MWLVFNPTIAAHTIAALIMNQNTLPHCLLRTTVMLVIQDDMGYKMKVPRNYNYVNYYRTTVHKEE